MSHQSFATLVCCRSSCVGIYTVSQKNCAFCLRYLVSFASARYCDLLVENREIFIPLLYLAPPQGVTPSKFREDV